MAIKVQNSLTLFQWVITLMIFKICYLGMGVGYTPWVWLKYKTFLHERIPNVWLLYQVRPFCILSKLVYTYYHFIFYS